MIEINPKSDLLFVVDAQTEIDFITGSLAVKDAAEIIPIINKYMEKIKRRIFSRDGHPKNHISFAVQGGPWPDHRVEHTEGIKFHPDLDVDSSKAMIVSKGIDTDKDAYSAFDGTGLDMILPCISVKRVFFCGLATDYCVKATVLDALKLKNLQIYLLIDAIRAMNIKPGDGNAAIIEMCDAGAIPMVFAEIT